MIRRGALLIEGLAFGSVDEALQDDGAILNSGEGSGGDGKVVADEVEFRELDVAREIGLVGIRDADFASVDGEEFGGGFFWHVSRLAGGGSGSKWTWWLSDARNSGSFIGFIAGRVEERIPTLPQERGKDGARRQHRKILERDVKGGRPACIELRYF